MTALSRDARVAGLLYIVASAVAFTRLIYIPGALFVRGNAAATAANIASHETLFRFGIATYLVGGVLWLFVPLALYRLLDRVDHTLAVLMVILGALMQTPIYVVNTATDAAALLLVNGADFLAGISKLQRETFAMLCLRVHHQLDLAGLIFAGLWLVPFGLLVYRSRFLPRVLGLWLIAESLGWVALSLSGLALPQYEDTVFKVIQPLNLGEVAVMLWLVILGAKEKTNLIQ